MNVYEFLARVAEEYKLSFSELEELFHSEFYIQDFESVDLKL